MSYSPYSPELKSAFDVLCRLPFFSGLSDEKKRELLKVASFKQLKTDENLFLHGDPITCIYWVCKGAVRVFRVTPKGRELTLKIATVGDALDAQNALQEMHTHNYNARAVLDTTLFAAPVEWILGHLENNWNHMSQYFIQKFVDELQRARVETEHRSTFSVVQNIACYLQHLCVLHQYDPHGFTLPYPKKVIASRLGVEMESLSRALPRLREYGINVRGKQISFSDMPAVQRLSCGACTAASECQIRKGMPELAEKSATQRKNPQRTGETS